MDYPIYSSAPVTSFTCDGRDDGLYSDVDTQCQAWHQCLAPDRMWTFLCPNGTIFNQEIFTCVWWFNYDCQTSVGLYDLNSSLYVNENFDKAESVNRIDVDQDAYDGVTVRGPTPIPGQLRRRRGNYRRVIFEIMRE